LLSKDSYLFQLCKKAHDNKKLRLISVTNKAHSPETEDIDRLVKWYQTDSNTSIRHMTWQEEIDDANDRADKAEVRAEAVQKQACKEKARADKYEKILKEHGLL